MRRLHRALSLMAAPSVTSLRRREIFSTDGIIGGLDVKGFFPAIASKQSDAIANGSQVERSTVRSSSFNGFFPAIASKQSDAIANGSQVERSAVRSSSFDRPPFLRDNFGPFGLVIEGEMWGPPHTLFGAECNVTRAALPRTSSTARSANDRFRSDRSVGVNYHR